MKINYYFLLITALLIFNHNLSAMFSIIDFDDDVKCLAEGKSKNGIHDPSMLKKIENTLKIIRKECPEIEYMHCKYEVPHSLTLFFSTEFSPKSLLELERLIYLYDFENLFWEMSPFYDQAAGYYYNVAHSLEIMIPQPFNIIYDFERVKEQFEAIEGVVMVNYSFNDFNEIDKCEDRMENQALELNIEFEDSWIFKFNLENKDIIRVCYNSLNNKIRYKDYYKVFSKLRGFRVERCD